MPTVGPMPMNMHCLALHFSKSPREITLRKGPSGIGTKKNWLSSRQPIFTNLKSNTMKNIAKVRDFPFPCKYIVVFFLWFNSICEMQREIANQKAHIQPLIKQNAKGGIANTDYSQRPQSHCFAHCFTKTAGKRALLQRSGKGQKKNWLSSRQPIFY